MLSFSTFSYVLSLLFVSSFTLFFCFPQVSFLPISHVLITGAGGGKYRAQEATGWILEYMYADDAEFSLLNTDADDLKWRGWGGDDAQILEYSESTMCANANAECWIADADELNGEDLTAEDEEVMMCSRSNRCVILREGKNNNDPHAPHSTLHK